MSDIKQFRRSYTSGGAVPRYSLVKLSSGKLVVTTAKADAVFGVSCENSIAATDLPIEVDHGGIVKAIAGAAINLGASLMAAAGGKVVTHDASGSTPIIGKALEAATVDGEELRILLYDYHPRMPT